MREKLLISACLLGEKCKYDGGSNYLPAVEKLKEFYDLTPVCPEVLGGLPTPREPSERLGDRVVSETGRDVTGAFQRGAERALEIARETGCTRALLKERSPSCGCGAIYDGSFTHTVVRRDGVAAERLAAGGITVYGESQVEALLCREENR